jgi:hypothetical protein
MVNRQIFFSVLKIVIAVSLVISLYFHKKTVHLVLDQHSNHHWEGPILPKSNSRSTSFSMEETFSRIISETATTTEEPLNILLLYADDWRHDTLSSAETGSVIKTPFLDLLAEQGMRFLYNCVTSSICWISRVTLLTGQFQSRHKQTTMKPPIYFYKYWNETFPGKV